MQHAERGADAGAMKRLDAPRPHSGKKGHHRRRAAAQLAQGDPIPRLDGERAGDAVRRQVLHQRDKERQILARHALFVKRQDEVAALGGDEEVRVLDTFCDALAGQHLADVVKRNERSELVICNIGVNGHRRSDVSFPATGNRPPCFTHPGSHRVGTGGEPAAECRYSSKGKGRGETMNGPIPAQKEPYGINVEAGKRYFWCACGRSASQPFCDGSHQGTGLTPVPFTAEATEEVWLCGCKATGGKPFCDGTHNTL